MLNKFIAEEEYNDFREFISFVIMKEGKFFLRNDIVIHFNEYCQRNEKPDVFQKKSSICSFVKKIQEFVIHEEYISIMFRIAPAVYRFFLLRIDGSEMEEISLARFLDMKDEFLSKDRSHNRHLHIDYLPFYDYSPSIKDPRKIGNGIAFLSRYLSSNLFTRPEQWISRIFEFIKLHRYNERQLLVNGDILKDFESFRAALENMILFLAGKNPDDDYKSFDVEMKRDGFESGWGNTAGRIMETMQLLVDLVNEPNEILLENFLARVPMPLISKIAIISPHGWFAQENVLGRPDTGGQVIYILDQVRALEKHLKEEIELAGLDVIPSIAVITRFIPDAQGTSCNVWKEKIHHTDNSWILRIPFKDNDYNIVNHWISRFDIWPYLEQFADDAAMQIVSEFRGRPDLIIGNYSDGNLVASMLSEKLDVIQCTIAHALEKTKYLFSDMYWQDYEEKYNFSLQFTADLIAMNRSDFIITSTHQEIIGTEESIGQYESYQFFTMPDLYQVHSGINLFAPKFNVIPPGVDEKLYFPYYEKENRLTSSTSKWEERLFTEEYDDVFGKLDDPEKMPIFTMARLDRIKNITGLIEAYGISELLRQKCNLIFAAGTTDISKSSDREEQEEIEKVYSLIDEYSLNGNVRWLPSISKLETGEVYRVIADKKGIFVQPALFEAFGLTILEAMLSGLPTFATQFGGPCEIITEGSGYLLNTSLPSLIAEKIELFMIESAREPDLWKSISDNGIKRVRENFTWELYSGRLINLTKLYGFWRYSVSGKGRIKMDRYSDFLFHFLYRQRAENLLS